MAAQSRAQRFVVDAETLSEIRPIVSAPTHFQQVTGEKAQECERKEKVVEEAYHSPDGSPSLSAPACFKNRTSVAPYFRARTTVHSGEPNSSSCGRFSSTKSPSGSS